MTTTDSNETLDRIMAMFRLLSREVGQVLPDLAPIFQALLPAAEEIVRGAFAERSAEQIDRELAGVIALIASFRSEHAPALLVWRGELVSAVTELERPQLSGTGDGLGLSAGLGSPVSGPDLLLRDDHRGEIDAGPRPVPDGGGA